MKVAVCFILSALIVLSGTAYAQEHRSEISLSVGAASAQDFLEAVRDIGVITHTAGFLGETTKLVVPAIAIHYRYHLDN